jgi:hypothetical protein
LLDTTAWFSTRSELLREKARALAALGRHDEASHAMLARARESNGRKDWYDAAWARLEREDVEGAAAILLEAAARQARKDDAMSADDYAGPLLDALAREGRTSVATQLRARLALASR